MQRVCYLPEASTSVYCHDAANGQLLARTALPEGSYDALALDADNQVMRPGISSTARIRS